MKKVYGFEELEKNILNNFKNGKLHHCNLINGKKGVGKFTFVKNMASIILSQKNNEEPNESETKKTSKLMESGGHTDFSILDLNTLDVNDKENTSKKGEINVGQVKKVIGEIKLTPSISKNKVLIIDSIDNINVNGQNTLLKTLEEPPKNTYIFLICHNINKVIRTIQSRSNVINVNKLSAENWEKAILDEEEIQNFDLDEETIEDLYELSECSVGYAIEIAKNNSVGYYDEILKLMTGANVLEIQKFAEKINSVETFNLFSNFFDKVFQTLVEGKYIENDTLFYKKRENILQNILKNCSGEKLIENYEMGRQIINDINSYNLDKKHCISVLFNRLNG